MAKTKTQIITDTVFAYATTRLWSNRNQEEYYQIELIDNHTGKQYLTYASPSYGNYSNWKPIIQRLLAHPHRAIVLTGSFFAATKSRPDIISADSQFTAQETVEIGCLLDLLRERDIAI